MFNLLGARGKTGVSGHYKALVKSSEGPTYNFLSDEEINLNPLYEDPSTRKKFNNSNRKMPPLHLTQPLDASALNDPEYNSSNKDCYMIFFNEGSSGSGGGCTLWV